MTYTVATEVRLGQPTLKPACWSWTTHKNIPKLTINKASAQRGIQDNELMICRSENPDLLRPKGKEEVQRALHKRLSSLFSSIRIAILEQLHGLHSERERDRQSLLEENQHTTMLRTIHLPSNSSFCIFFPTLLCFFFFFWSYYKQRYGKQVLNLSSNIH